MGILLKHGSFVKSQIDYYDRMAVKNRSDPKRLELYSGIAQQLRSLLADIEGARELNATTPESLEANSSGLLSKLPHNFFANPLALTSADVAGLPDDVIKELNISESDKLELSIIELVNGAGGTLILDKIIAGLHWMTGETHQRVTLTSKLYRMGRKGLIFSVPKKKGVYTTLRPETANNENHDQLAEAE